eukprot:CAMPEP_0113635148 /NCGR_PEP_ID=MMETSP0017_2-20120614/18314_1 /TAXON_ID=2856 /ORGANISM="Cylindrotheca closterium" /LENGTH=159 /DNA_ID=CAMNT_0000545901 /DNA_START=28 /DNA_END=507 /DNA_ORIENTATION=- /assembly_acc=CAM_ASM_000147
MKSIATLFTASLLATSAAAFSGSSSFSGSQLSQAPASSAVLTMEYIPSGMSKEQWKKMKEQEQSKNKGKNLGKVGITSFKSRSFAEWQKAGGKNLFPVDPKKVKDASEIPYMQRQGGKPDDSDLKGGKKGGFSLFGGNKKKAAAEPAPEPEKKTNWWTL